MAWAWSHTAEGYDAARKNLGKSTREFLEVAFAEIRATGKRWKPASSDGLPFFRSVYARELVRAKKLPSDILADAIWEFAEQYRTCDNGGGGLHMCPYGCHTVEHH
jgi:hypothetical protein